MQKYADNCFQSTSKMQFLGRKEWRSANVKHVCWKIFKVRKVFDCIARAYYFQCQAIRGS